MTNALERLRTLTVSNVMARDVVWVTVQQPMAEIAGILLRHQISSAPVVDESGICVGIISATDFLRRDADRATSPTSPTSPASPASPASRRGWTPEDVAGTYMSTGVQSIPAGESILRAAKIMCNQHVHRLPVVSHDGRPVGIISTMDIIAALDNAIDEMSGD